MLLLIIRALWICAFWVFWLQLIGNAINLVNCIDPLSWTLFLMSGIWFIELACLTCLIGWCGTLIRIILLSSLLALVLCVVVTMWSVPMLVSLWMVDWMSDVCFTRFVMPEVVSIALCCVVSKIFPFYGGGFRKSWVSIFFWGAGSYA